MEPQTYREFWEFYRKAHSKKATQAVHALGLFLGIGIGATSVYFHYWAGIPLAIGITYLLLWLSHIVIEKNMPATFKYPLWSFISEFRMVYCWLKGTL